MKEKKAKKVQQHSDKKKHKKDLEEKLAQAFTAVAAEFGKPKKVKSVIEKFAKQLGKKVEFEVQEVALKAKPIKEIPTGVETVVESTPPEAKKTTVKKTVKKV